MGGGVITSARASVTRESTRASVLDGVIVATAQLAHTARESG
jgi:hypothetical protein